MAEWKESFGELWDGTKIYIVDGDYVRDKHYVDFTMGGHGYRYDFIPKDEIWLERMLNPDDDTMDLVHEIVEYILMKYVNGYSSYNKAHPVAATIERIIRKATQLKRSGKGSSQKFGKFEENKKLKEYLIKKKDK